MAKEAVPTAVAVAGFTMTRLWGMTSSLASVKAMGSPVLAVKDLVSYCRPPRARTVIERALGSAFPEVVLPVGCDSVAATRRVRVVGLSEGKGGMASPETAGARWRRVG